MPRLGVPPWCTLTRTPDGTWVRRRGAFTRAGTPAAPARAPGPAPARHCADGARRRQARPRRTAGGLGGRVLYFILRPGGLEPPRRLPTEAARRAAKEALAAPFSGLG